MSNVVSFSTSKKQSVKRWSPQPFQYYSFAMKGAIVNPDGSQQPTVFVTPASHYEGLADIPTWNLMWAFYDPHGKETNDDGEISYSALNPRVPAVELLTRTVIGSKQVRDWMVTLGPVEVIDMMLKHFGKSLPFPARSVEELRERAYQRVAHLATEEA